MSSDWVAFIEAVGSSARDLKDWGDGMLQAARSLFSGPDFNGGIGLQGYAHDAQLTHFSDAFTISNERWPLPMNTQLANQFLERAGHRGTRNLLYPRRVVITHTEFVSRLATHREEMRQFRAQVGADLIGIVVHPVPGLTIILGGAYETQPKLTTPARRRLTQAGMHLENAYRLRLRPELVRAVVTATGKIEHWDSTLPPRETLQEHVRAIEVARSRRARREPDAIALWSSLVDGRLSLVARGSGRQRHYLMLENPPERAIGALSGAEVKMISLAARGLSSKLVAYTLGLREAAVSSGLANAAAKLGVASKTELLQLAAILTCAHFAGFDPKLLTASELQVLEHIEAGLTNAEIAALRHRSVRTIANQVAAMLRKTHSPGRRALATLRLRSPAER